METSLFIMMTFNSFKEIAGKGSFYQNAQVSKIILDFLQSDSFP